MITEYVKTAIVLLVIDIVWIKLVMSKRFNPLVRRIQKGDDLVIRLIPSLLSYAFLVIGLQYFIINKKATASEAFLLGIIIYGVFEATSMAIFKDWDYGTLVLDTLWGGILYYITYHIVTRV